MDNLTLKGIVQTAIATEEHGQLFYENMASKFSNNPMLVELFQGLSQDEMKHKHQYQELMGELTYINWETVPEEDKLYFQATSRFFNTETGPFKDVDKIKTEEEALRLTYEFEKATLAYYQGFADIVGHNHEALNRIIRTEKHHVFQVMKLLITDGKYRSLEENWSC